MLKAPLIVYEHIDGPSHVHPDGDPATCEKCSPRADIFRSLSPEEFAALPDRTADIESALAEGRKAIEESLRSQHPVCVPGFEPRF